MSSRRNPVVTGPLSSALFKLLFVYIEPLVCLIAGYYAMTKPSEFVSGFLDLASLDEVAKLFVSAFGVMLVVFGLILYFGLKHSTAQGRFWIIFSLLIGDLLTIFGLLQVNQQFPGKPFFMGYNVGIVASVGLAIVRSAFMLLAIWYEGNNLDRAKTH